MDGGTNRDMDVSIIDKDESSDKAYHVVDGFVIEDSKKPFPVSCNCNYHYFVCVFHFYQLLQLHVCFSHCNYMYSIVLLFCIKTIT